MDELIALLRKLGLGDPWFATEWSEYSHRCYCEECYGSGGPDNRRDLIVHKPDCAAEQVRQIIRRWSQLSTDNTNPEKHAEV